MSNFSVTGPCVVVYSDWAAMPAYEILSDGEVWYEGAMECFMGTFDSIEDALEFIDKGRG